MHKKCYLLALLAVFSNFSYAETEIEPNTTNYFTYLSMKKHGANELAKSEPIKVSEVIKAEIVKAEPIKFPEFAKNEPAKVPEVAKAESTKTIEVAKAEPTKFQYEEVAKYIDDKQQEKKIQTLANYISNEYNVEMVKAETIVKTSFTESEKHNIDPTLILSIIGVESRFNPKAISGMGAVGLTQVMPQHHKAKILDIKKQNLDLFSIKGNIMVGTQIIKEYIARANGNIQNALQMYNGSLFDKNKSYSKKVLVKLHLLNNAPEM